MSALQGIAQVEICGVVKTAQGRGVDFINVIIAPANSPKQSCHRLLQMRMAYSPYL